MSYNNPTVQPCVGIYSWVPPTPISVGQLDALSGFDSLVIDRGKFRNYYLKLDGTSNIVVSSDSTASQGNIYAPIFNSTRPISLNFPVINANNTNFAVNASNSNNFIIFDLLNKDIPGPISSIEFDYDLSFQLQDSVLTNYPLTNAQSIALKSMKANGKVDSNNLSIFLAGLSTSITALHVFGVDSSGKQTDFPIDIYPKGLPLTRLRNNINESNLDQVITSNENPGIGPVFSTYTLKIKQEQNNRDNFPTINKLLLQVDQLFKNSSLQLVLKKIKFFTADRVNFRFNTSEKQLPCNALGYSLSINGYYYPGLQATGASLSIAGQITWPQDGQPNKPVVNIKLFNPNFLTKSPGFAHSLNLHLLILSFPTIGPLGDFLLPGVSQPWYGVVIGPVPYTEQFIFTGTNIFNAKNITAVAQSALFKKNNGTLSVLINGQNSEQSFIIKSYKDAIISAKNSYNNYQVTTGFSTNVNFQNLYVTLDGINVKSEVYTGVPERTTSYLQAYQIVPDNSYKATHFIYQSYLDFDNNPNLYDIFTNNEPCLIFNLNQSNSSSNIFQSPGFLYAGINCFKKDITGLFDTKLIFRIYASDSLNPNPNSDFAVKHTFKIVNNSSEFQNSKISSNASDLPGLIVTSFNSNWNFSNVLISSNILDTLSYISSEIFINSSQNTFSIASGTYNLFCAIYAVSTLNDNYTLYNTSSYSSLDLPLIDFYINNDFVLALPIYSIVNNSKGGTIIPEKNYGYKGQYTPDSSQYTVYDLYYNGSNYSSKDYYKGNFDNSQGLDQLLVMKSSGTGSTTIKVSVPIGSNDNPSISEYDFYLQTNKNLLGSKIDIGQWIVQLSVNSSNLLYKFEIDYIDSSSLSFISKIVSSNFSKSPNLTANVNIPFELPNEFGIFLLKLYVYNTGENQDVNFNSITLNRNTIKYFDYTTGSTGVNPSFYEDLPLQPENYVGGCNQFNLYLDPSLVNSIIYDSNTGLYIDGTLYSPTWAVNLPEKMELSINGSINPSILTPPTGSQPYEIYFRTGIGNNVISLDSKKDPATNLPLTYFNQSATNNVYEVLSEGYARFVKQQSTLKTTLSNNNLSSVSLEKPVVSNSKRIYISGISENSSARISSLLEIQQPGIANQPAVSGTAMPIDNSGNVRVKLSNCSYSVFDTKYNSSYFVGVTNGGNLLYAEDAINGYTQNDYIVLVEGNPNSNDLKNLNIINFSKTNTLNGKNTYNGLVNNSYPSILAISDRCVVFYVYKTGSNGIISSSAIYCKYISKVEISDPILVFDFGAYYKNNSGISIINFTIHNLSTCHNEINLYDKDYLLAFDLNNKVFFAKIHIDPYNVQINDLLLVYGSLQNKNDSFTSGLINMINNGSLSRLRFDNYLNTTPYSTDLIQSQKVGLLDFDGIYAGVQFLISSNQIAEVVFDKSYTLPAEYRVIGKS